MLLFNVQNIMYQLLTYTWMEILNRVVKTLKKEQNGRKMILEYTFTKNARSVTLFVKLLLSLEIFHTLLLSSTPPWLFCLYFATIMLVYLIPLKATKSI